jgi:hypothetical protein
MQVPGPFEYERATSIDHAVGLLDRLGDGAMIVAGGHSLLPMMKLRIANPEYLIDINDLHGELGYVEVTPTQARLGAMARHAEVLASADLLLVEASAAGPDGVLAVAGSRAAAAVAYCSEIPVWSVVGVGRRLPAPMWGALLQRLGHGADPWELDDEVVPAGTISHVIGPDGYALGTADLLRPECPTAPELLKLVAH